MTFTCSQIISSAVHLSNQSNYSPNNSNQHANPYIRHHRTDYGVKYCNPSISNIRECAEKDGANVELMNMKTLPLLVKHHGRNTLLRVETVNLATIADKEVGEAVSKETIRAAKTMAARSL